MDGSSCLVTSPLSSSVPSSSGPPLPPETLGVPPQSLSPRDATPPSLFALENRRARCLVPIRVQLFPERDGRGSPLCLTRPHHWYLWAHQQDGAQRLQYASLRVNVPVRIYLAARYEAGRRRRAFLLPLTLGGSCIDDLDAYLRDHLTYSATYNPYGSGGYLHWSHLPIRYYLGWTFSDDGGDESDLPSQSTTAAVDPSLDIIR